jgi:hypothetical protein
MTEYQIDANTRRCAASGRELRVGERFFSVLLQDGSKLIRQDYSSEAWQGPPHGAIGFWSGRIPAGTEPRRLPVDDDLLLDCLERLEGETDPARVRFRYVAALLLMRRKRLKFEEAGAQDGQEILLLRCPRSDSLYRVANPRLTEEEMAAVQEEVFQVLGWQ